MKLLLGKSDRELNRGLRSGIALIVICLLGTVLASWISFDTRNIEPEITSPNTAANFTTAFVPETEQIHIDLVQNKSILKTGILARNSTPLKVLIELGADSSQADKALRAFYERGLVDPRRIPSGLSINAFFDSEHNQLISVSMRLTDDTSVFSKRLSDETYFAAALNTKLSKTHLRVTESISTSLYQAGIEAGLEDKQIAEFAQIFAFDVDFQREVRNGDSFEIVYEAFKDERGKSVRTGDVIFAAFQGQSTQRVYYRHTPEDDQIPDYFTSDGKAATRFLMKTPINGARLSSSFGRRRHPISGYSRLHKGTDFAARSGTPIMAAGNGIIERASRYGGYGNYVRIQHANGYETAYAHMSGYGPGIRSGVRVRQGQVIGYVGSTGASTGPHLHYEVLIKGKHVNAMSLKLPTGRTLEGDLLNGFLETRNEIDRLRHALGADIKIAHLKPSSSRQLQ